MCCGRGRTGRSLNMLGAAPTNVAPSNRLATRAVSHAPITPQNGPAFEYVGKTAVTVLGPITGASYRFERTGSRLRVDPRDRAGLVQVPVLRLLK